MKNEVKKNIGTKGVKCNKSEDTGTRSRPNDFPHLECGTLRNSIAHELDKAHNTARVGTNLKHAKFLELGTKRMAKRPFLRPTLAEQRRAVANIMAGRKLPHAK